MRVQINAGGREVVIDCADTNVSVKDIAGEALAVWTATSGAKRPSDGPAAFGLTSGERASSQSGFDWRVGEGQPTPVQAVDHG